MLTKAASAARQVLDVLGPFLERGLPIVVVEPSCLATFRDEFPQLVGDDPRTAVLASLSRSLAEHLDAVAWTPATTVQDVRVSIHPHCHQRATGGSHSDVNVLARAGFDVEVLDLGCCGLAGSFGFEAEHDELSREIARDRFIPGITRAATTRRLVMDGFSCELQTSQLTPLSPVSLAELLVEYLVPAPR
jgi:Fe-S oxidoreductase